MEAEESVEDWFAALRCGIPDIHHIPMDAFEEQVRDLWSRMEFVSIMYLDQSIGALARQHSHECAAVRFRPAQAGQPPFELNVVLEEWLYPSCEVLLC